MARAPDALYRRAKREGYAARSVYKLKEIDSRFGIIRRGSAVLDLGCSPGSWLQYAAEKAGAGAKLVGVDIAPVSVSIHASFKFIRADVITLGGGDVCLLDPPFDVVLSDLAPKTTGIEVTDCARSLVLARQALAVAREVLRRGGHFVCKIFQGSEHGEFISEVKQVFGEARFYRPSGSRKQSREIYIVGLDFMAANKAKGEE